MREPLLDWQREGRLLKDARVGNTEEASSAEAYHIAAKACTPLLVLESGGLVIRLFVSGTLQLMLAAGKWGACKKGCWHRGD